MKKIIALALILCTVFALASCGIFGGEDEKEPEAVVDIAAIQAKIDISAPDAAEITVLLKASLGDLNGAYSVLYNEDGTATVAYSYELFNAFGEGDSSEIKSVYTGTTTVGADGALTEQIGGVAAVEAVTFEINLDGSKLESETFSNNILSAKVKAADTEAILGVALEYDADLIITIGDEGVTSVSIAYSSESGPVEIVTTYEYFEEVEEEEDGETEE